MPALTPARADVWPRVCRGVCMPVPQSTLFRVAPRKGMCVLQGLGPRSVSSSAQVVFADEFPRGGQQGREGFWSLEYFGVERRSKGTASEWWKGSSREPQCCAMS